MTLLISIIWISIGLWTGIKYGDLWSMFITLPIHSILGPIGLGYHVIKEILVERHHRKAMGYCRRCSNHGTTKCPSSSECYNLKSKPWFKEKQYE